MSEAARGRRSGFAADGPGGRGEVLEGQKRKRSNMSAAAAAAAVVVVVAVVCFCFCFMLLFCCSVRKSISMPHPCV